MRKFCELVQRQPRLALLALSITSRSTSRCLRARFASVPFFECRIAVASFPPVTALPQETVCAFVLALLAVGSPASKRGPVS